MASAPGLLTDWPWKRLGNFKYLVLAPWVAQTIYSVAHAKDVYSCDFTNLIVIPLLLWRMIHNQIWISVSRYTTAKGGRRIVHRPIEFDQVDRERNWDDQILFHGILLYMANFYIPGASHLPLWRSDGLVLVALIHAGPVEFLYYWLHRALHHHFLFSRYHSHHHSSIATEPITSVIHPFAEHIAYYSLFGIPLLATAFTGTASTAGIVGYTTYLDFMNNMGHCNFELIPKSLFSVFPFLKYFMYTPSFHSLHHTQFRTNYSLFMPIYDYIYGTTDKTTDHVYEGALKKPQDRPDVVHLTHMTTPESIYHMRLGFASLASQPHESKWYIWAMWPLTAWTVMLTWIYGRTFVVERNRFRDLNHQTWAIPKYSMQYNMKWQRESINSLIEEAILRGEEKRVKVMSLGLLNQGEEMNGYGELYVQRHPKLAIKVVDGSSLAVAVVLHSLPKGTARVVLKGNVSKVARSVALSLCRTGVKVVVTHETEHSKLLPCIDAEYQSNLMLMRNGAASATTWLVGEGWGEEDQRKAPKGTLFIPYSQLPPKKLRRECRYHTTPAMVAPVSLQNVDSCENWLGRRVMSAWRVAGMVHGLEEWGVNECGRSVFDVEKIWEAALRHGFQPLTAAAE